MRDQTRRFLVSTKSGEVLHGLARISKTHIMLVHESLLGELRGSLQYPRGANEMRKHVFPPFSSRSRRIFVTGLQKISEVYWNARVLERNPRASAFTDS